MTQQEAFNILKTGVNVYITGAAGSGKTHLLNMYIDYLKDHEVEIGITASTGIAATHMGGVTIHSWTGLGVRNTLSPYDLEALEEKPYLFKRMEKVKVLIIDEVSMLHHFRLDLVEKILRSFKRNDAPFGGIQVILCGDFFQLPPVSRYGEPDPKFIYHATSWKEGNFKVCYLEEQYRHNDDISIRVLNDIRESKVDEGTMNHVRKRFKSGDNTATIKPTRLYTHNIDVDYVNEAELKHIPGDMATYKMETVGKSALVEILQKSCLASQSLNLKVGAKVMFVKNNFEVGYANGTLGIVKKLKGYSGGPVVETLTGKLIDVPIESWIIEEDGKIKAELKQYPLRLAWAITIHKCQGMSLDAIEVDLSKSFEKGMGYVALSRVRSWNGLSILGFNERALEIDGEVLKYDRQLRNQSNTAKRELYEMQDEGILKERQDEYLRSIAPSYVFEEKKGKVLPKDKRKKEKIVKLNTFERTLQFLKEKIQLKEIATHREMGEETILNHIEKLLETKAITLSEITYLKKSLSSKKFDEIASSLKLFHSKHDEWRLSPVKNTLGANVSYRDIQLVRLFVRK